VVIADVIVAGKAAKVGDGPWRRFSDEYFDYHGSIR
jgi:hypothetical protein